jgi:nucleotide-binding universal stress UspA family protein
MIGGQMRILLAVDGSESSDRATRLLSNLQLPPSSLVHVVAVHEPAMDALAMTWPMGMGPASETTNEAMARSLREAVDAARSKVRREGLEVTGAVPVGLPGSRIVEAAATMGADLIVIGSRGHGRIASMLLGSTASEVVDHAPCPVLVARHEHLAPLVVAEDGSTSSREALEIVETWPIFAGVEAAVVTVADVPLARPPAYPAAVVAPALEEVRAAIDELRTQARSIAAAGAERLSGAGLRATAATPEGEPATELVRYAQAHGTGTIVMGTRGHTGLPRLLLGSTARNVVLHAPCSVLVVRERRAASA